MKEIKALAETLMVIFHPLWSPNTANELSVHFKNYKAMAK